MDLAGPTGETVSPTVLFVDDDADTLDMYATYFELSGMSVAKSTQPDAALALIATLRPDLVITDIGFAGRDAGVEFIRTLKSDGATQQIPVIVLSGRSADQLADGARDHADLYLVKPVLPDALLMDVQRLIAMSHTLRDRCARAQQALTGSITPDHKPSKSRPPAKVKVHLNRRCPTCHGSLEWIERGRINGVDYDYYRWCGQGCGLYCFDRAADSWLKLV